MKLTILTEAGSGIGLGHLMRCKAIASGCKAFGFSTQLIVNTKDISVSNFLTPRDQIGDWLQEPQKFESHLVDSDLVLIDSYQANAGVRDHIYKMARLTASMEDQPISDHPERILCNTAIFAEKNLMREQRICLYGSPYAPLREEFQLASDIQYRDSIQNILITLGGSDESGLTPKIVEVVQKKFPHMQMTVIVGPAFSMKARNFRELKNVRQVENPDAAKMRKAMLNADIAISAAGQTLYELASVGLPTIAIRAAENQQYNFNGFQQLGFTHNIHQELESEIAVAIEKLQPVDTRRTAGALGKANVDGLGNYRIAKSFLESIRLRGTPFRPVTWPDADMLLEWRNDPKTIAASLSNRPIGLSEHLNWLRMSLAKSDSHFWIFQPGPSLEGTVRFERVSEGYEMSWTMAPSSRGKGLGKIMVTTAVRMLASKTVTIYAKVLESNLASKRIAEAAGFQLVGAQQGVHLWRFFQ